MCWKSLPKTALTQSYCLQWGQWGQCVWLRLCESLCQFLPESESIIQVVRLHIVGCGTVCLCLFDFWPFGACLCVCVCVGGGGGDVRYKKCSTCVWLLSLSGGTKWVKVIKQALANSFLVYCPSNEQIHKLNDGTPARASQEIRTGLWPLFGYGFP